LLKVHKRRGSNKFGAFFISNLTEMAEGGNGATSDESMKLAIAISLLRSKLIKNTKHSNAISPSPSQSETLLRWKRKVRNYSSPSFLLKNPMRF